MNSQPPTGPAPVGAHPFGAAPARHVLTRAASLALLASGGHGRVAATMRAVPVIIPVRFSLVGEDIVFSPGFEPDLFRAVADSVVAFETDHLGPDGRALWEVHVLGMAETLTDGSQPPGLRLSTEIVTGYHVER